MGIEADLTRINAALSTFNARKFLSVHDVYQEFLEIIVAATGSKVGYLHLYSERNEEIALAVWSHSVLDRCQTAHTTHYPLRDAGIWADAIRQRRTVVHNDYAAAASEAGLPDGHFPISRHMSAPVVGQDDTIVAIVGVGNREEEFDAASERLLERVLLSGWSVLMGRIKECEARLSSRKAAYSLRSPDDVLLSMVGAISRALELRDEYTIHHQENVAMIADAIAVEMNLDSDQRLGLRIGATLHDIGKIAIPTQILSKVGKLTHAEFELIKTHAERGAQIFDGLEFPWPLQEMIRQHHERIDGSGYPLGLRGDEISLEARIIGVADTLNSMVADRPYRFAPGLDAAITVIRAAHGIQFDAYVVDALFRAMETGRLKLPVNPIRDL